MHIILSLSVSSEHEKYTKRHFWNQKALLKSHELQTEECAWVYEFLSHLTTFQVESQEERIVLT